MQTAMLNVQGMTCNHCVNAVQGALKQLGATATVDLARNTVVVEYDAGRLTLDAIREAIEDQGYDVIA